MVVCPACKMKIKGRAKECPRCGWEFEKTGKFNCPFCGALIPVESDKCPECHTDFSKLPDKARTQSIDMIRGMLLHDLADIESPEFGEIEQRFTCPKCGAVVNGEDPECLHCGQILIGQSGLRCPVCMTAVGRRRKKCPTCGASLASIAKGALPMAPFVPRTGFEQVLEPEQPSFSKICSICGATYPEEMLKCPICQVEKAVEAPEPKAELVTETPHTPVEEPAQTATEPLSEVVPEASPSAPEAPTEQAPEHERVAEPEQTTEPERVTTVRYTSRSSERGLSNGLARINGTAGRTNGTGAVNGKAFVNGTGISNGLGPRSRGGSAHRGRALARWQIIAVLVAIMIIVPGLLLISYSNKTSRYSIDGSFGDWSDATTFGTRIWSTSSSSNITEWAVAGESSDLYLYFATQEPMMSSPEAESYYLLVDSDGDNSTGYVMDSIGAEYMLRLTGWSGTVDSSSLFQFTSSSDRLNWSAWSSLGSLECARQGAQMEARAGMPVTLKDSARFLLLSKDSLDRGSVSYAAPMKGPILIIEQIQSEEIAMDGLVPQSGSVEVLKLRFTSDGGSGIVNEINPTVVGATFVTHEPVFALGNHETRDVNISVDTSAAPYGKIISADLFPTGIISSYTRIEIIGSGARAYVANPPSTIIIDGAFADWSGRLSTDIDHGRAIDPSVDVDRVGNVSDSSSSFFYVSVEGEMCSGSYIPASVAKPSGTGGGSGVVIPSRLTAEDVLRVYVDSDRSSSTGELVALDSKLVGADQMIEIKGLFGRITSMKEFNHSSSGDWVEMSEAVKAAKDTHRMEIGITAASLEHSSEIDFIVETTSWKGLEDLATFNMSALSASTSTWVVEPITTSQYATSMSYQRKMFYDGVNYWSFFYNGKDTVCKYSMDDGHSWVMSGLVFTTPGVNETSIWYDPATKTVYAVGDTSSARRNVSIQVGTVDAPGHRISWANRDSELTASSNPIAGKNTYISKDAAGYLWVLSTNWTQVKPLQHDLSAFRSRVVNSTSSWMNTGEVLPYGMYENNSKGSLVPAGSGSDMWVVYGYAGYVAAKKYDGAWPADYDETVIYRQGTSWANTDNSPPSVVVDGKGIVHVVYGTGRATKDRVSIPQIEYSHSLPDLTFTVGVNLDLANQSLIIANYYPTISLETSTDSLYVLWLQSDFAFTPKTVMGRKCISGTWTSMVIVPQTGYTKQYMTSVYSVSGEFKVCWQWTQNSTAPLEVLYDSTWIPEFGHLIVPIVGFIVLIAVCSPRIRKRNPSLQEDT